jgi:predicted transcriptional regulator
MSNEVQMSIKLDRELRDEFTHIAATMHRPAAQVIQELMRNFVERNTFMERNTEEPNDETIAAMKAAEKGELLVAKDVHELLRQSGISCES